MLSPTFFLQVVKTQDCSIKGKITHSILNITLSNHCSNTLTLKFNYSSTPQSPDSDCPAVKLKPLFFLVFFPEILCSANSALILFSFLQLFLSSSPSKCLSKAALFNLQKLLHFCKFQTSWQPF